MHLDAFQTLADPTRRRIVEALRSGERQVNDIVAEAGVHQSGVSRHLRILDEAGFVSVRPDGQRRLYSLRPDPFRELEAWLGKYRGLWEARLDRFGAALEERRHGPHGREEEGATHMNRDCKLGADGAVSATVVIERTYRARPQELWDLWTTKEGFESWWGPEGFRVEVHAIDARLGGLLHYDMIADAPAQVAAMRKMGQPVSHETRGTYSEMRPLERLALTHVIDFLPGLKPFDSTMAVDFFPVGDAVRMVVTLDPMPSPELTRMSTEGFTSQIGKLGKRFA